MFEGFAAGSLNQNKIFFEILQLQAKFQTAMESCWSYECPVKYECLYWKNLT